MNERVIAISDVLVMRQNDVGWHCEREGEPLFIACGQVAPGKPMPPPGTQGTIHLREFAIWDLFPADVSRSLVG